ncbi:DNA polymerase III subunit delta' [Bacillus songklensis]|uniref:DNA polymerase III subunit delta n=1 Tax=Bacillus songklensis TaxID=1069116 RepID=A0ABV8AVM4_9BACI
MSKTWDQLEQIQPNVMKMLKNSLLKNRVAHAYIFEGGKGTGKKDAAFLFAKSIFCLHLQEYKPCHTCINCRRIDSSNHPDVHYIEPDGLSIKKEQIQHLQSEFTKTGLESNRKLYIIEQADKMTVNAANSLLKFLEEPSSGTYAVLLTEHVHKLLNTIVSRCQIISFRSLTPDDLRDKLMEQGVSQAFASLLAQLTNDLEETMRLYKDEWFGLARKLVIQLNETLATRPQQSLLLIHEKWMQHFSEKGQMELGLNMLLMLYRDLLSIQLEQEDTVVFTDRFEFLKQQALQITQKKTIRDLEAILKAKNKLNSNMNLQLLMEQLVLDLQEG